MPQLRQIIKAQEMVGMWMGDDYLADAGYFAGGQGCQLSVDVRTGINQHPLVDQD
jgi:hypothetical protein